MLKSDRLLWMFCSLVPRVWKPGADWLITKLTSRLLPWLNVQELSVCVSACESAADPAGVVQGVCEPRHGPLRPPNNPPCCWTVHWPGIRQPHSSRAHPALQDTRPSSGRSSHYSITVLQYDYDEYHASVSHSIDTCNYVHSIHSNSFWSCVVLIIAYDGAVME